VAIHDNTYLLDFSVQTIEINGHLERNEDPIADYVIEQLESYEHRNLCKFVGAGLPVDLIKRAPKLCSRLWLELDIVPITIKPEAESHEVEAGDTSFWSAKCVDEQADSMARKCVM
jgi:hypothetical protein